MTESIWFTDCLMRVHVAPEDTDGAYALVEALAPSGHLTPPHVHEHDAEGVFVLEGELTLHTADGPTVVRPGQGVHLPAGEPHALAVTSAGPARVLTVSAPAGFVGYLRDAGRPAEREALPSPADPPDVDRLLAAAAANGMTVLGAPGVLPVDLATRA